MNKLLMEENERLQKQVSQLVYENGYMKQQLQNVWPIHCKLFHVTLFLVILFPSALFLFWLTYWELLLLELIQDMIAMLKK